VRGMVGTLSDILLPFTDAHEVIVPRRCRDLFVSCRVDCGLSRPVHKADPWSRAMLALQNYLRHRGDPSPHSIKILSSTSTDRTCSPLYRLISDVRYALGHAVVAEHNIFNSPSILGAAVSLLSLVQGMYAHKRATLEHVPYDDPNMTHRVFQVASIVTRYDSC